MTRDTRWFKSSHSDAGNDTCVEVRITSDAIGIRDSKARSAGELRLTSAAWSAMKDSLLSLSDSKESFMA